MGQTSGDNFGSDIFLSSSGNSIIIGAPYNDGYSESGMLVFMTVMVIIDSKGFQFEWVRLY